LNEVKNSKNESFRKTDIHYISRNKIPEIIKKFYLYTYGLNVIENVEILDFLKKIDEHYAEAENIISKVENLQLVMNGTKIYLDKFLKLKSSLSIILIQAGRLGIESDDVNFLKVLNTILEKKREFCKEDGAWDQYEHLADWLIDIASLVVIKGTDFETDFCEIVRYSLNRCSKKKYFGYSWYAYWEWKNRWDEMKIENQVLLQEFIENNHWSSSTEITEIYK